MTRARTWLWTVVAAGAAFALACGSTKTPGPGAAGAAGASGQAGTSDQAGASGQAGTTAGYAPAGTGGGASGDTGAAGTTGAAGDTDGGAADVPGGETGGACTPVVAQHADEGAIHVPCTPVPTYKTNPPSSGNHYGLWADFKTYATPVPWGHLVHSLEHGAVVIVYNCPGGCPAEVAAAQAMIDALPADAGCTAPTKRRVILAPDPKLDVRWAATAWTWTIRSSCFDAPAFSAFATAHYGKTFEDFCTELHQPLCDVP